MTSTSSTGQSGRWRVLQTRGLYGWGAVNLFIIVFFLMTAPRGDWPLWGMVLGLAFLIISLPVHIILMSRRQTIIRDSDPIRITGPTDVTRRIFDVQRKAVTLDCESFASSHMLVFAKLLLEPQRSRRRIKETIAISSSGVSKAVQIDFHVPRQLAKPEPGTLLAVPVMRPLKGRLITELELSCGGQPIATLTAEDTLSYTIRIARWLLTEAYDLKENQEEWPTNGVRHFYQWLIEKLISVPGRRALEDVSSLRQTVSEEFDTQLASMPAPTNADRLAMLRDLVRLNCTNYNIVALVPMSDRMQVDYGYTVPLYPLTRQSEGGRWRRWKGEMRSILGGMPRVVELSSAKARKCESYHAFVRFPDDFYVADLNLLDADDRRVEQQRGLRHNLGGPYFRLIGLGLSEVHFYSRGMRDADDGLRLRAVLSERPPGALGRALLAACLTLVAVAFLGSRTLGELANVDAPALVVAAVPLSMALVAFVLNKGGRRRGVISYVSLASALLTAGVILATTGLAVNSLSAGSPQWDWATGGMTDWRWSILLIMATINTMTLIGILLIRTLRTQSLAARVAEHVDDEKVEVSD